MGRLATALARFARENTASFFALLYLLVCLAAYAVYIPFLGFYWDDWPTIFYTYNQRFDQLINHFSYDRPFSVWAYALIGRLGTAPIVWHVAALLIRWGIVVAAAWALKPLWPQQTARITFVALMLAIYPGYYLHPSAVIFSAHLVGLALFFVSLGAMGRAVFKKRNSGPYWVLSLAAAGIHMFSLEYYVGLELIRPVYLWIALTNSQRGVKPDLKRILVLWAPFLLLFAVWMTWRLYLLDLPSDPYPRVLLAEIKANPLAGISHLARVILVDFIYVVGSVWAQAVRTLTKLPLHVLSLGLAAAVSVMLFYTLTQIFSKQRPAFEERKRFSTQAALLGVTAFVAGLMPVWVIGETIAQEGYNLRYILTGMFGAALLLISAIVLAVPGRKAHVLIISVLVGLAVASQVRNTDVYLADWQQQRDLYWQFFWRAPAFEENTALIAFERLTTTMGDPMTGNALNVLYPTRAAPPQVELWNFELFRTATVNLIRNEEILQNDYRGLMFSTRGTDDLVFYYKPIDGCLWLLTPLDVHNEYVPEEHRDLAVFSNLHNVLPKPYDASYPDPQIFGKEQDHGWCYYFQKASLARQTGDWTAVIDLMNTAETSDLNPAIGVELLPLIEAYIRTSDWQNAVSKSIEAHQMDRRNASAICALWASLELSKRDGLEAHSAIQAELTCE